MSNIFLPQTFELAIPSAWKWLRWWRICLQGGKPRFDPWVRRIPWRREWLPIPVFMPGEFHGQMSLVGYSPLSCKEWIMIEANNTFTFTAWKYLHNLFLHVGQHSISPHFFLCHSLLLKLLPPLQQGTCMCALFIVCTHHENWLSMKFKTIRYFVWCVHHCILTSRAEPGTEREASKSLLAESPASFSRPKSWMLKGQYCEHAEFWNEHFFCHVNSYFPNRLISMQSSYRQESLYLYRQGQILLRTRNNLYTFGHCINFFRIQLSGLSRVLQCL